MRHLPRLQASGNRKNAGLAATAAVLAGIVVAGCGGSGNSPVSGGALGAGSPAAGSPAAGSPAPGSPGPGSPAPGSPAAAPPASSAPAQAAGSTCYPWSGLQALNDIAFPLREMAGDEGIYGAGSTQVNSDMFAVVAGAQALNKPLLELPPAWFNAVQNEVMSVAVSPDAASPEQLTAAADNAQYLASQISQLCFSSPA